MESEIEETLALFKNAFESFDKPKLSANELKESKFEIKWFFSVFNYGGSSNDWWRIQPSVF